MVFKYTEALALDLRVFAKHGKRAIVSVDDVKCVARKDPKLVRFTLAAHLRKEIRTLNASISSISSLHLSIVWLCDPGMQAMLISIAFHSHGSGKLLPFIP